MSTKVVQLLTFCWSHTGGLSTVQMVSPLSTEISIQLIYGMAWKDMSVYLSV